MPRYAAEMEVLEQHDSVWAALDYLRTVPHLGDGTLSLVDRDGHMAVVECGHTATGVMQSTGDYLVSTNHFRTPALQDQWNGNSPLGACNNTQERYSVTRALARAAGQVEVRWARRLMAMHGGPDRICCHRGTGDGTATISTVLFLPAAGTFHFANGQPCRAPFQVIEASPS